jgi:metallo-beta-lactamase class B
MKRWGLVVLTLITAVAAPSRAQQGPDERAEWNQPVEPFRVIGNIHYVGAAGVSSFLIVTPEGSILLDGALPETVPQITRHIASQGARMSDVKYLLNSHAHFDHAGGLAELKKLTGASLVASSGDAPTLTAGRPDMPAVAVDRLVNDGDTVQLGGTVLTARVTPGHTKGCTTWTMTTMEGGKRYDVVFYCSTSVVDRLVGNTGYPDIVADYERTFAAMRQIRSDVFLANHPGFFRMATKRKQITQNGPNPFIDSGEMARFVDDSERQFRAALEKERNALRK